MDADLLIRRFAESDAIDELTDLLHRSYAGLARMGLRYTATHQDSTTTRRRMSRGECFVAASEGKLVGTILLIPPGTGSPGVAWYARPDVAVFGQFAVDPVLQGRGLGKRLLEHAENRARELGARELALDTADQAAHLIAMYERWGFRLVDETRWEDVNYRSVIMSRPIAARARAAAGGRSAG